MRKCFYCLLFFAIILSATLSQAAGPEQDVEAAIDEEFKWLQEEAEAQFVTVATKTKMTAQEAPSIVSVITTEEIRNMGARGIVDVLRTVPGFDLTHALITPGNQISIRGMRSSSWNDKIKIMINGHSMQVFFGEPYVHFDLLPIGSISKIEIIRGPGSALYGTGAFLGVINIITKQGGDGASRISLEGGSDETAKPQAEFSYKKDEFKAYLYADYYQTDGYDGRIESDMATNAPVIPGLGPMFAPSASRKLTCKAEHYTLQTNISYKDLYFSGFFQKMDYDNPVGVGKILTDEGELLSLYAYGEIGYNASLNDKGNLLFKTYYDYGDQDPTWEIFPEETAELPLHPDFPPGEGLIGNSPAKLSVTGAEITGDYEMYPGFQLVGGASYEHFKLFDVTHTANHNLTGQPIEVGGALYPAFPYIYFPDGMTDISENANWLRDDADRKVFAAYLQGTIDLKKLFSLKKGVENLSFTLGGRYDDYDDVGSTFNPRFGLVYAPTEALYFKGLYGEAFRAPSFKELYLRNNPSLLGNEETDPEEITTFEWLVGYNFTRSIRTSLTYFDIQIKDLIQAVNKLNQNIGEMAAHGIEAELKLHFDKHKYAYLNFTWQDVKNMTHSVSVSEGGKVYTQEDFNPGGIPEFYGNIGVNYDINKYIVANASLNYVGERDRTEEKIWIGEELVRKDLREPVKDRFLVNASLTFGNFMKGLEIQLSGFNLLDDDHREPDPDGYLENDMPRSGRSFMGRVSYSF